MNATTSHANISVAGVMAHAQGVQVLDVASARQTIDGGHDQQAGRIETAQCAALAWLALMDAGNFTAVWLQCAQQFRGNVNRSAWEKSMQTWRAPLGVANARKLHAAKLTRSIPAAPLGEYVLLQYTTQFAHAASAVETVTLAKDQDGAWQVSAYYFK